MSHDKTNKNSSILNIEYLISSNTCVLCRTQAEAIEFIRLFNIAMDIKNDEMMTFYKIYRENTCYSINHHKMDWEIMHTDVAKISNMNIVTLKKLKDDTDKWFIPK
jgi:hypothetical protein